MKIQHLIFSCLLCLPLMGEDFVLKDGSILRDAKVTRSGLDHVIVTHSSGVKRVEYDELTIKLQERFDMQPEQVKVRVDDYESKRKAEEEKKRQVDQEHRQMLRDSKTLPRFLTAADVVQLFVFYGKLTPLTAEYLASEWNRREAIRLKLPAEAKRYAELAQMVRDDYEKEREQEIEKEKRRLAELRRYRQMELALTEAKAAEYALQKENEKLEERIEEAEEEYKELFRDYQRERDANRYRYYGPRPIVLPGTHVR